MSKFCILLSVVILVSGFCFFLSHASAVRQSKGQSKVTPKGRLQTTTQSDYFFDGSGYGESGFDPNFDDTEGGDDDDDDDDYLGSGLDYKTPPEETSPTVKPLLSTSTTQQTTFSTIAQVTVDVEPTESPESVTLEAAVPREVVKEHQAVPSANTSEAPTTTTEDFTSVDLRISTPHFALNSTPAEASSPSPSTTASTTMTTTASPTTTTISMTTTQATTSSVPLAPTSRTSQRPARRTATTTRRPSTRTTTSFKDDDLDGGDDDDAITDLDINNNLNPTPGKGVDGGVSIDKQEEDTNEVLSNLPVMYRVSNLPKLAFLSQSGVLAGMIAGSIVVLLCLVLLIMFVVYHLKRKSEPAFDRPARSPVKAGYKKALDKDIYG